MAEEERASETPGPDPENTPGLEGGGSVPPGETPPGEAGATRAVSHPQHAPPRSLKWLWIAGIAVVVLLFALFFASYAGLLV